MSSKLSEALEETKKDFQKSGLIMLARGDKVEKIGGKVRYQGTVLTSYYTLEPTLEQCVLRYVVQIYPQGFQYIASPEQLTKIEEFKNVI